MTVAQSLRSPLQAQTLALALTAALVSCAEPHDPSSPPVSDPSPAPVSGPSRAAMSVPGPPAGSGAIHVFYEESADYDLLARSLAGSGLFEQIAQATTSVVALPADLEAIFTECGQANAFYGDGQVIMCYELFDSFTDIFLGLSEEPHDALEIQRQVFGTGAFVYMHEIGHALVDQLQIPITAREEDSVDTLAALMLILGGGEEVLWAALSQFAVTAAANYDQGILPFWDEHSLAAQRYYDVTCLIYGSNPEGWAHIVPDYLPAERAPRCPKEFAQKSVGWDRLLAPYYHPWPLACDTFPPQGEPVADCAHRDPDGEIVLRPWLLPGSGESDEVRAVIVDGELLFAVASGRTAPALPFDNGPDYFAEGLARTIRDGKVGFVNEQLELAVPRQWDFAFPFENGVARVCTGCSVVRDEGDDHGSLVGGAWGMIDREGRILVPVEYEFESLPAVPPSS